ncbi:predicted protein [Plenodomus lingam JN3]|uniref:Predicted protein n=1 Tax=Leptosphaeria maculans (strain JN3 / isolate v23.1.3 / race Av1-4-5-6-7-8) TaxID=985895 RepID=E4ZVJ2_LEPMJ|nr:predicted protein [Plenodomus lingam JN3]CBX95618.1 predicted protein [Plenodomus lingam JN3]
MFKLKKKKPPVVVPNDVVFKSRSRPPPKSEDGIGKRKKMADKRVGKPSMQL